jgi:hypothetical protein
LADARAGDPHMRRADDRRARCDLQHSVS